LHLRCREQSDPDREKSARRQRVGEAGTIAAIPAVMNAVNEALARIGAPYLEAPATSEKLWLALRAARTGKPGLG
jgi:carbon-monoxide dehydrogenase large subunit